MRGNEQEGRMERKQLANNNNGKFVIGSGSSWYGGARAQLQLTGNVVRLHRQ